MKLNLKPIQKTVEGLMTDQCVITRDPSGTADDTWDSATGKYTRPYLDVETIYSGPCMVNSGGGSYISEKGGVYTELIPFIITLPKGSGPVAPEDHIQLLSSEQSPHLVGRLFYADGDEGSTFSVTYRVHMHTRVTVPGHG